MVAPSLLNFKGKAHVNHLSLSGQYKFKRMTKSFSARVSLSLFLGLLSGICPAWGQTKQILIESPHITQQIRFEPQTNSYEVFEEDIAQLYTNLPTNQYVSLHQHIPAGTRLKLYNPKLQKAIYVKNEGIFASDDKHAASLMLSQRAIKSICPGGESNCELEVSYPAAFSEEINHLRREIQKVKTQNAVLKEQAQKVEGSGQASGSISLYFFVLITFILALWYTQEM